uniref:Saposin B-type domain-containing protein n=1 Tax=Angiostrongylus cantonensis TaxID=6313 RepID=A0A0K0CXS1_ANGCA
MRCGMVLVGVLCMAAFTSAYKKPLCELCENIVDKVDEVLKKGGDVEKVLYSTCILTYKVQ